MKSQRRFPFYGWVGAVGLLLAEVALALRLQPITQWFTPIAWTFYLLIADGLVKWRRGDSMLADRPREAALMFWLSNLGWIVFEAYNLRLRNWAYINLPPAPWRTVAYLWSFGTIFPAVFETSDVLESFGLFRRLFRPLHVSSALLSVAWVAGVLFLIVPPLLVPPYTPWDLAPYLFGFVWVGFIFLLEPLHFRLGLPSLIRDWEAGNRGRTARLLLAGFICGLLWEFWNFWSGAKWVYLVPILHQVRLFEMPVLGYLGFPPFAIECWLLYHFLRAGLGSAGGLGGLSEHRDPGRPSARERAS